MGEFRKTCIALLSISLVALFVKDFQGNEAQAAQAIVRILEKEYV